MKVFNIGFLIVFCGFLLVADPTRAEEVTDASLESSGEQPENTTLAPQDSIEENTTAAPENVPESNEASIEYEQCEIEGNSADPNDCRSYNTCSADTIDGSLKLTKNQCQENEAFSENFNACTRDIASCHTEPECVTKGNIPDPTSDTSYFWCAENFNKDGLRKYHVKCRTNEVFVPAYADCVQDISLPFIPPTSVTDEELVKRDNKLLNGIEKQRAKEVKRKIKEEAKLLKEEEKRKRKAAKEAEKAAEKARKEQAKKTKNDNQNDCIEK